jgi:hypothetical protein
MKSWNVDQSVGVLPAGFVTNGNYSDKTELRSHYQIGFNVLISEPRVSRPFEEMAT